MDIMMSGSTLQGRRNACAPSTTSCYLGKTVRNKAGSGILLENGKWVK